MKSMVGLVFAILIICIVTLFWPSEDQPSVVTSEAEIGIMKLTETETETEQDKTVGGLSMLTDDNKSANMAAEYKLLEIARKDLTKQLAILKHEMWRLQFPAEEAKQINQTMLNAYRLTKNPDMQGAFSDVDEIRNELDKVTFAIKALEAIKSRIASAQDNGEGQS